MPVIITVYLNMYVAPYRIWNVGNIGCFKRVSMYLSLSLCVFRYFNEAVKTPVLSLEGGAILYLFVFYEATAYKQ